MKRSETLTLEEKVGRLQRIGVMPLEKARDWLGWSVPELDKAMNNGVLGGARFVGGKPYVQQFKVRAVLLEQHGITELTSARS